MLGGVCPNEHRSRAMRQSAHAFFLAPCLVADGHARIIFGTNYIWYASCMALTKLESVSGSHLPEMHPPNNRFAP